MNASLVSVVMCTYNGSSFVAEQLDSICGQTYRNLEIIIVDDASTDTTYEILSDYANRESRIRLMRNEQNLGFNKNFSNACGMAKGDFIAISDQDDIWNIEKISRILANWKSSVPLMYCDSVRFSEGQDRLTAMPDPKFRKFEGTDSRKLALFNTVSGHAMMIRRTFLPAISPFPDNLMYDWWAGAVAACNGGVGYFPETLVFQRIHEGNVTVEGKYSRKEKKHLQGVKKLSQERHLSRFATIPGMPDSHRSFFKQLLLLWSDARHKRFSWPLFVFLLKNSGIIFNSKKKKVGWFSNIKHSYRLASN